MPRLGTAEAVSRISHSERLIQSLDCGSDRVLVVSIEDNSPILRPRSDPSRMSVARAVSISLAILLNVGILGAGFFAITNQQRISDQFTVWQFEPSSTLEQYVTASGMSDEGKFLFYASQPKVETNPTFNQTCSNVEENFGVLGCYFPTGKSIFLFDVTDERLAGIEEVVAAHEMLHAAWDRLSKPEQTTLSALLETEAARMKDDPEFSEILAFYAKTEPGERANELHSIVGTEFPEVSDELEAHYATYFTDRSRVVSLHLKSNAVFTEQLEASEKLVTELDALNASIETDYARYNSGYDSLNADIDTFNERADSGDFTSFDQFDRERDALIGRQNSLNSLFAAIEKDVAHYDDLVEQLDALNANISELNRSINIEQRSDGL